MRVSLIAILMTVWQLPNAFAGCAYNPHNYQVVCASAPGAGCAYNPNNYQVVCSSTPDGDCAYNPNSYQVVCN